MSENGVNTLEKGRVIEDAVTLYVGGKIYEGWEDVKVVRQVNALASSFDIQLTDRWAEGQETWSIKPGQHIHIHGGKRSLLTGYVDAVKSSISAQSRSLTISGRSRTADLVDCSVEGPSEYLGLNLKEIAEKISEPFGIKVLFQAEPGSAFDKITLQNGETGFALLDRLTRERKLLMYPSYEGSLIFANQGSSLASTQLKEGSNVLSANSSHDFSDRFSKYVTKGQNLGTFGDTEDVVSPEGEATDEAVSRYRPTIILAENPVNGGTSEDRASYEATMRAAKSQTAEVEVQGWFQAPDVFWDINQLVFVDIGSIGLRRKMLVDKVSYNKTNAGTRATLSLVRQDAYNFSKKVKKEKDLSWTKFI